MAEKDDKKEDKGEFKPEFEIVETTDKTVNADDKGGKQVKAGYEDDTRLSAAQRDDDDAGDADDTEVEVDSGNQTKEETEAKRERRRRERKAQKARQSAARDRDNREMHFLRTRNEQLERAVGTINQRVTNNEVMQVEGRLEQLKASRLEAEEVLARAIDAGNGSDVVKLNRVIRDLDNGIGRLSTYKGDLEKQKTQEEGEGGEGGEPQRRQAAAPPPSVVKNLEVFAKRHTWFNPNGSDEDSRLTRALDEAVLADGFDPATKDYWIELEERMQRRLPERMAALNGKGGAKEDDHEDDDAPPRRNGAGNGAKPQGGGPRMSSGSQTRGSGKQFLLSAERKTAMVEAGVWDDLELRDKYIRAYSKWDKENPPQSGR